MTVFKTFLKVLYACKFPVIMYTVILIFFGSLSLQTSDTTGDFISSKPDVLIINNDTESGITEDFVRYISDNSNIIEVDDTEEARKDALFYRDVNFIIYIPSGFRDGVVNGDIPYIDVESTGDYQASLASMIMERYLSVLNLYNGVAKNEEELISMIDETLSNGIDVSVNSKLDTDSLSKGASFYNFANYSILAGCVYVVCLIMSSFKCEGIRKRTIISSVSYKKFNRQFLMSNSLFAIVLWLFYVILSFIIVGSTMFSVNGVMFMLNSLVLSICALSFAFLLGNLVSNKDAINGIVTVVSLGSSFLCGVFVPMQFMPESVIKISHILPSYWYVKNNDIVSSLEINSFSSVTPVIVNMLIILGFAVLFVIISNVISRYKRKLA